MKDNYISVAAAVISAVSLTVSWLNYRRDRSNAKVIVFRSALVGGGGKTEPLMSINITNTGRRPLTISLVGYRMLWDLRKSTVLTLPSPLPKKLAEGDDVVCLFKKSDALKDGSWKNVAYIFAVDSTGKEYRRNMAPPYEAWTFRLLERLINPIRRLINCFKRESD